MTKASLSIEAWWEGDIRIDEWDGPMIAFACGHADRATFKINTFGEIVTLKPEFLEKRERCGVCEVAYLRSILTACVACKRSIFPGDQVAIYTVGIGCMRRDCSGYMGAGALAGHWDGQGVKSLFEPGDTTFIDP